MRVAVTGASGFVGRALLERSLSAGFPVVALLRAADRSLPAMAEPRITGDLSLPPDMRPLLGDVDVLVHAAARVHVMHDRATKPLAEFRRVNVSATERLARQAAAVGVRRLVFLSSIKVNGERTVPGRPFMADDGPAPEDAYGVSKLEAEQALRRVSADTGLQVVIVRPPLVYGPGVKGNLARLLHWLERGIPLPFGAVDNRRSLIALDNLTHLLLQACTHPRADGQVLLVSDDHDLSTPDLIRGLARGVGRKARLWPLPVPLLRSAGLIAGQSEAIERLTGSLQVDISRTRQLLGWKPPVPAEAALAMCARRPAA